MKIRKLKIKNYKVFGDVEFDFTDKDGNTLDTVVLAGINGSGKTSVLEILKKIFDDTNSAQKNTLFENLKDASIEVEFQLKDENHVVKYSFNSITDYLNEKMYLNSIFTKFKSNTKQTLLYYLPVNLRQVAEDRFEESDSKNFKIIHLESHKSEMSILLYNDVNKEVYKNRNVTISESVQKSIDKVSILLKGIKVATKLVDLDAESLIFESATGERVKFDELSNGEQNLYFKALYLRHLNINNSLILIDEPEDALHPTWQKEVAKLYQNVGENNQVIMATHSPHVMASVEPKSLFVLHINDETRKVEVINMEKVGKHTKGLEPNRILREVMELDMLRDYEIQSKIDKLSKLLIINEFEKPNTQELIEELTDTLGKEDPFIIRMEHQLLMLNRQKLKTSDALR